jgi:hypothetical protein
MEKCNKEQAQVSKTIRQKQNGGELEIKNEI